MKILFIGKGVSNNGAIKLAEVLNLSYDYIDVLEENDNHYDIVVKGPGISYDTKMVVKHLSKVITDIEFAFLFYKKFFIGITGTNGKTSTTQLITDILFDKYNSLAIGTVPICEHTSFFI